MITQGSLAVRSASSLAVIRTSVMAGLSCSVVEGWGRSKNSFFKSQVQNSDVLEHLAKLLGGRSDDGDEVGLAKPALGAMALQIAARAAVKHRRVRGGDAGIARLQAKVDDAAPIAVIRVERIARQRHGLGLDIRKQTPKVSRLLREIAIDVAERALDFVHDRDAVPDQADRHAGLQQNETAADFLDVGSGRLRQDQIVGNEDVAELHTIGSGAVHGEERIA